MNTNEEKEKLDEAINSLKAVLAEQTPGSFFLEIKLLSLKERLDNLLKLLKEDFPDCLP